MNSASAASRMRSLVAVDPRPASIGMTFAPTTASSMPARPPDLNARFNPTFDRRGVSTTARMARGIVALASASRGNGRGRPSTCRPPGAPAPRPASSAFPCRRSGSSPHSSRDSRRAPRGCACAPRRASRASSGSSLSFVSGRLRRHVRGFLAQLLRIPVGIFAAHDGLGIDGGFGEFRASEARDVRDAQAVRAQDREHERRRRCRPRRPWSSSRSACVAVMCSCQLAPDGSA